MDKKDMKFTAVLVLAGCWFEYTNNCLTNNLSVIGKQDGKHHFVTRLADDETIKSIQEFFTTEEIDEMIFSSDFARQLRVIMMTKITQDELHKGVVANFKVMENPKSPDLKNMELIALFGIYALSVQPDKLKFVLNNGIKISGRAIN